MKKPKSSSEKKKNTQTIQLSEIDVISCSFFDILESFKDLFFTMEKIRIDLDKVKTALKDKNIIE
jgi:hypothetical protein